MDQRVVEDPVFKQRLGFESIIGEQGEPLVLVKMWVDPGGGVPAHVHPATEERFEVQSGRLEFLGGKQWTSAGAGEQVVVPAGVRHAYRNPGDEVAHSHCTVPASSLVEEFLDDGAALARAGMLTRHVIPKSIEAALRAAVMAYHYRDQTVLSFPPPALQRLLMPPLARLGARRGYVPGRFAEQLGV